MTVKFNLGKIVATPGAMEALEAAGQEPNDDRRRCGGIPAVNPGQTKGSVSGAFPIYLTVLLTNRASCDFLRAALLR